jgi:hypothetical protein
MKKILISFLFTLSSFYLSAQWSSALKQAAKSEGQILKNAARTGDEIANGAHNHLDEAGKSITSASHAVEKAIQKNVNEFYEELFELSVNIAEEIADYAAENHKTKYNYLFEIEKNDKYNILYQAICKKLNKDNVNQSEARKLLLGREVDGKKIEAGKLYGVYFNFSNSFAKDELSKMLVNSNCSEEMKKEVKSIAEKRDPDMKFDVCQEENNILYTLLGIAFLGFLAYCAWEFIVKWYKILTNKKK